MEEIFAELLSSSSSSSSSSNTSLLMFSSSDDEDLLLLQMQEYSIKRESRHHEQSFVDTVVKNYSETEFRNHFRVSRRVANHLTYHYQNSVHFKTKSNGGRKNVSAESQCLSFLWFAGNKESYREVAKLFKVAKSAAHRHLTHFMEFLFDISTEHIKFPSTDNEKADTAREFAKIAGFPNVLGCIDGSYVLIRKPVHKVRSTCVNRNGLISLTLQGICDADKKFFDVCIGSPSKINDCDFFKVSPISAKLPAICGKEYHILGDPAYPLREFLLTPYKNYGNLNARKLNYNEKHCQTRIKIENAFDLLKQRFRQLFRLNFFSEERMCKFVLGCCVIHNLCIENGDLWDEPSNDQYNIEGDKSSTLEDQSSQSKENVVTMSEAVLTQKGEAKRIQITEFLVEVE